MSTTLQGLGVPDNELLPLLRRWHVGKLALFGSFARGEARPDSDVDLMVTFLPGQSPSLWDFVGMKDEFEALFKRPVDLVVEGSVRNPIRRRSMERDLTVIYAA